MDLTNQNKGSLHSPPTRFGLNTLNHHWFEILSHTSLNLGQKGSE